MQKRLLFLFALLVMFASTLSAQVTTSALGGKVTLSGSNEPLIGASVQVVRYCPIKVCKLLFSYLCICTL